jgi:hypothetical protein
VIFWFLINYVKNMDGGLLPAELYRPVGEAEGREEVSLRTVIEDYFQYKLTRLDYNKTILKQNLLSFQKEKLVLTRRVFTDQNIGNGIEEQMDESELFEDLLNEESKEESEQSKKPDKIIDVSSCKHSLMISSW